MSIVNPYLTVYDLFSEFGILKRKADKWRLTQEAVPGQINGLEDTDGLLLATDGVHCLILRHCNKKELFEGNLDFFVVYKPKQTTVITKGGEEFTVGAKIREEERRRKAVQLTDELLKSLLTV